MSTSHCTRQAMSTLLSRRHLMKPDLIQSLESLRQHRKPIADLVLRVQDKQFYGSDNMSVESKEMQSNLFLGNLLSRALKVERDIVHPNKLNHTILPAFDIFYFTIHEYFCMSVHSAKEQIGEEIQESEDKSRLFSPKEYKGTENLKVQNKLKREDMNIEILRGLFGFKDIQRIEDIKNQGILPLDYFFEEVDPYCRISQQLSSLEIEDLIDKKVRRSSNFDLIRLSPVESESDQEHIDGSDLMTQAMAKQVTLSNQFEQLIPSYILQQGWQLLYQRHRDGASYTRYPELTRLVNMCQAKGELVFLVMDTQGSVFGAYLSTSLQVRDDFYGTGESLLFKKTVGQALH